MKAHMFHLGARTIKGSYYEKSCMLRALSHCLIFRAILIPLLELGYIHRGILEPHSAEVTVFALEAQRGGSNGLVRGIFRKRRLKCLAHVIQADVGA